MKLETAIVKESKQTGKGLTRSNEPGMELLEEYRLGYGSETALQKGTWSPDECESTGCQYGEGKLHWTSKV